MKKVTAAGFDEENEKREVESNVRAKPAIDKCMRSWKRAPVGFGMRGFFSRGKTVRMSGIWSGKADGLFHTRSNFTQCIVLDEDFGAFQTCLVFFFRRQPVVCCETFKKERA